VFQVGWVVFVWRVTIINGQSWFLGKLQFFMISLIEIKDKRFGERVRGKRGVAKARCQGGKGENELSLHPGLLRNIYGCWVKL
jgi:hypothetical protein